MAAAALTGLSPAALGPSCDAPAPPASLATAPSVFLDALVHCSKRQRCSVLQHGVVPSSEALFAALPSVAFFVVEPDETAAKRLVLSLAARNASHVHVLAAPLDRVGAAPMRNAVLNPGGARRLTALQALQTSNEFFDLQLVHAAAAPSAAVARSLLALAPATLLLLPTAAAAAAWRAAVAALPATPPRADDAVGAAVELAAEAFDGCAAAGGLRRARRAPPRSTTAPRTRRASCSPDAAAAAERAPPELLGGAALPLAHVRERAARRAAAARPAGGRRRGRRGRR